MHKTEKKQVVDAIHHFLSEQLSEKLEPELKDLESLEKTEDSDDAARAQQVRERIAELHNKYALEAWMQDAATRMAKQLRFGTHISKGVHPKSKGDNVNFHDAPPLPEGIVGSQTLRSLSLDATDNAAALPLATFFDTWVDESANTKIRDLIKAEHPAIAGVFSANAAVSDEYAQSFKRALDNPIENPATDGKNKQVLWPLASAIQENQYITLVPLHPSAMASAIYHRINNSRFSEENKLAKENRYKKISDQNSYVSIRDISVLQLGGTNPQNISQLTSRQSGRTYLLPSYPPKAGSNRPYAITKNQDTFFNSSLSWHCRFGLNELFSVVEEHRNTVHERDQGKEAMEIILAQIIKLASQIKKDKLPGWSKECNLSMTEKLWLDPHRSELEGEEEFSENRLKSDWIETVEQRFALWINSQLQKRFGDIAKDFADPEYREWLREIERARKASERNNEGVFA